MKNIDLRDIRIDTFQSAVVSNPEWEISVIHIPTGVRVGPERGRGSMKRVQQELINLLDEKVGKYQ